MRRKLIYPLLTVFALFSLVSCVKEGTAERTVKEAEMTLTLHLPASRPAGSGTRAISPTPGEENRIDAIDVLAFMHDGSAWTYRYSAENVQKTATGNTVKIKARVKEMPGQQVFMIVANGSAQLAAAAPIQFETLDEIQKRLVCSTGGGEWPARNNGSGPFTAIPMYARTSPELISDTNKDLGTYSLLRMLARINVTLESAVNNFVLEEACLFNYMKAGYISYENSGFTVNKATQAAVPAAGSHPGTPILEPTVFYQSDKTGDPRGEILYSIYTFESPKITTEAGKITGTALVVGGHYNSSGTKTWYRVDLKDNTDASANISSDLVRNHSYNVEIQTVTGSGYSSPKDAYEGGSRLTAQVSKWNDALQKTVIDEQFFLSVDEDEFAFTPVAGKQQLAVETNYDRTDRGFPAGIQVKESEIEYTPAVTPGGEWITLSNDSGSDGSLTRTIGINAKINNSGADRSADIHVHAGNMTKVIRVEQVGLFIRIVDLSNTPLTALNFRANNGTADAAPASKSFKVEWSPANLPLTLLKTTASGANEFIWQDATTNALTTLPAGGSYTFTIDPPAISSALIAGDPFYARASSLKFTLDDGAGLTADATLPLEQANYALVAENFTHGYDGVTRTGVVKSNTAWTVTVDNPSNVLSSYGPMSGSANTTGTNFTYTFTDAYTTATLTFKSVDGLFDDVVVQVRGSIAGRFARSHVVLVGPPRGTNSILTFAEKANANVNPTNVTTKSLGVIARPALPSNLQGVFFRWGSLVGVGPGQVYHNTNSIVYDPTGVYNYAWPGLDAHLGCTIPTVLETTSPFDNNDPADDDFANYNNGKGYDETTGKGDVCRYISAQGWVEGNWRLPTAEEFQILTNELSQKAVLVNNVASGGSFLVEGNIQPASEKIVGFAATRSGAWLGGAMTGRSSDSRENPEYGVFFPLTASISSSGYPGYLTSLGTWVVASSGSSSNQYAFVLFVASPTMIRVDQTGRAAWPVRCIRAD